MKMASFKIFLTGDKECARGIFNRFVGRDLGFSQTGIRKNTIRREVDGEAVSVSVNSVFSGQYLLPYLTFDGVIIAYDVSKFTPASLMSEVKEKGDVSRYTGEIMLVGHKSDLTDEKPHEEFLSEYTHNPVLKSFEVNLVTGINVEKVLYTLIKDLKSKPKTSNAESAVSNNGFLQGVLTWATNWAFSAATEEIFPDPYAQNLYETAIKEGTETDRSIRINVVGNYRQGKTSLVKRLLNQGISRVESTNGIDVQQFTCCQSKAGKLSYEKKKKIKEEDIKNRLLTVKIREEQSPSQPSTSGIHENMSQVQVNPIQSMETNATAECSVPDKKTPKPVLSTKYKKKFEKEVMKNAAGPRNNNNTSFTFWDFGGQFVFYATHSMFHSRKAIYLLVFDLTLPFDKFVVDEDLPVQFMNRSVEYYLRFWMNSIHSFVGTEDGHDPVVILVGTHTDKIKGQHSERQTYIQKYFNDVRALFDDTKVLNHIYEENFAISNITANDPDLVALRKAILKIGEERAMDITIPAKWIQLEKALIEIKDRNVATLQTVLKLDSSTEYPIRDIEKIKDILQYHHSKGTLVYFDESPISDFVILDPQFLIDAFKCIITSEQFFRIDRHLRPLLRPLWKQLQTEARLENSLVDYIWGEHKMFQENKKVLLGFLEKQRILTQAIVFDEATQDSKGLGWYIVPSLLKDELFPAAVNCFLNGKPMSRLQFVMTFEVTTLVELVFHRLLSTVAGKWPIVKYEGTERSELMIYRNACFVRFNNHAGKIEQNADGIRLAVVSCCPSVPVQSKEADLFRRFCESVVHHEFSKLKTSDGSQPKPYIVNFACNHEDHQGRGSKNYMEENACNIVPCPDLLSHDICVEIAKSEWYIDNLTNIGSQEELNERMLSKLSQCIGDNWELLGIELGLTQVQIDHLKADESTTMMKIYKMLLTWVRRRSITEKATLENFVEAVRQTPALKVDWDGVRNVADAIN